MASWKHNTSVHCPNILATQADVEQFPDLNVGHAIPVTLTAQKRTFESLAHLWRDWYSGYLTAERPRLMIRQEDLVYRPRQVMDAVRDCLGATSFTQGSFVYLVGRSKWTQEHVKRQSNMMSSMIKYAMASQRFSNMTRGEVMYAEQVMGDLMDLFHYRRAGGWT